MSAPCARSTPAHPGAADPEPVVAREAGERGDVTRAELRPPLQPGRPEGGDGEDRHVPLGVEGDDPGVTLATGASHAHPDGVGSGDDVGVRDDPPGRHDPPAAHLGTVARVGLGSHVHDRPDGPGDVGVHGERVVGCRNGRDGFGAEPLEHAGEAAPVEGRGHLVDEAAGGRRHELVDRRDHRRPAEQLARLGRATDPQRPGDHPQHEHRGDEDRHEAECGVDGPGRRDAHRVTDRARQQEHERLAEHGGGPDGDDEGDGPRGGPRQDAGVRLDEARHDPHREEGTADEPDQAEQGGDEALAPPAPRVEGEEEHEREVEDRRPAHSCTPRIQGDMTRSGSGRSRPTSQGSASPDSSKRLLSSIAVKPHTKRSPTSKPGPR